MKVLFFDKNFTRVENGFLFSVLSIAPVMGGKEIYPRCSSRSKKLSGVNQQIFSAIYGFSLFGLTSTNLSNDFTAIYRSGSRSCSVKFAGSGRTGSLPNLLFRMPRSKGRRGGSRGGSSACQQSLGTGRSCTDDQYCAQRPDGAHRSGR